MAHVDVEKPLDPVVWMRALNANLRTNYPDYGAVEIIDIASALEDPANPARIHPDYLDEEFMDPNAAYYEKIAQTVVDEATRFPPGAQL